MSTGTGSYRPFIKICGIRRREDAEALNAAMPDFAGFVFFEQSFRYVNLETALSLRKALDPEIRTAGVFVDAEPRLMLEAVRSGAVSILQLHGHEGALDILRLRELLSRERLSGTEIWKAFKVQSGRDLAEAEASPADRVLLDNGYGTGQCFDHGLIGSFPRDYILAGGLTPEKLPEVLKALHPAGADLSSGVETDRVKDPEKIRRAVAAVRGAYA